MTEQTDAAEVGVLERRLDQIEQTALRVIPTDVGKWALSSRMSAIDAVLIAPADLRWLIDGLRSLAAREAAAEARGAERALAAVEEVTVWMVPEGYVSGYSSKAAVAALRLDETLKAVRAAQVAPSRVPGGES